MNIAHILDNLSSRIAIQEKLLWNDYLLLLQSKSASKVKSNLKKRHEEVMKICQEVDFLKHFLQKEPC